MAGEGDAMTSQADVLKRVFGDLNAAGIDYMVVGSFAASVHGHVRDTHDLDLVVLLPEEAVGQLAERLGEGFYMDCESAREAVRMVDMFNAIHYDSGLKIDFWMLKQDEFSQSAFARRQRQMAWGLTVYVESAEDTVLSKLLWNRISPSDRQINDVRGILRIKGETLDYEYLRLWAEALGLSDDLSRLVEELS